MGVEKNPRVDRDLHQAHWPAEDVLPDHQPDANDPQNGADDFPDAHVRLVMEAPAAGDWAPSVAAGQSPASRLLRPTTDYFFSDPARYASIASRVSVCTAAQRGH